jgi:hypothetical protein
MGSKSGGIENIPCQKNVPSSDIMKEFKTEIAALLPDSD